MAHKVLDASGGLLREPLVFKRAAASTGTVAVWTPASGKRFRLLKYLIEVTMNAAISSAGPVSLTLEDSSTTIFGAHSFYAPGTAVTATPGICYSTGIVDLGKVGIPAAAVNDVLNIVVGQSLTSGSIIVHAWGTEEA